MDRRLLFPAAFLVAAAIVTIALPPPQRSRHVQLPALRLLELGSKEVLPPAPAPDEGAAAVTPPESVAPAADTATKGRKSESTRFPAHSDSRPEVDASRAASAGMVVGIDPETRRLGPATPEQRARLGIDDAMSPPASFPTTRNADGSLTVHTQGRLREFFVVRMRPDGKAAAGCVDGIDAAGRALSNPAPAATPEER
jgi:hypothetical protein